MLQFSEFVWTLRSSVLVVFNNFLLIDATARSKISGDQKRFFIALSLYPLSFFVNTPFNHVKIGCRERVVFKMDVLKELFIQSENKYNEKAIQNYLFKNYLFPVELHCT